MKKEIIFIAIVLSSCGGSDSFCECLEAGEELNLKTQEFFDMAPNEEQNKDVQELKDKKNELCAPYQDMDGDQLRELQKTCETSD